MGRWVLLGWGPIAPQLLTQSEHTVHAVIDREQDIERAMEFGIPVERGDPADPAVLNRLHTPVEQIIVTARRAEQTKAITQAATTVFPDATIVVASRRLDPATTAALQQRGATVIDMDTSIGEWTDKTLGDQTFDRAARLRRQLTELDGTLAVMTHANPDPDAIASAVGLVELAHALGRPAQAYYFGTITHQENRALVNLLNIDLKQLDPDPPLDSVGGIALVDHSQPGENDGLAPGTPIDIVIDHHQTHTPVTAGYTDRRDNVGATSTMLIEYLTTLEIPISTQLATALFYGIQTDTQEFTRGAAAIDFEMGAQISEHIEWDQLDQIRSPTISSDTFETIAKAIGNREQYGSTLISDVGELTDRDALSQAADRLLELNEITITLVFGRQNGTVHCSGRATSGEVDVGQAFRWAFDRIGDAGGHENMAGAQLSVGMLAQNGETSAETQINRTITARFLEALEMARRPPE